MTSSKNLIIAAACNSAGNEQDSALPLPFGQNLEPSVAGTLPAHSPFASRTTLHHAALAGRGVTCFPDFLEGVPAADHEMLTILMMLLLNECYICKLLANQRSNRNILEVIRSLSSYEVHEAWPSIRRILDSKQDPERPNEPDNSDVENAGDFLESADDMIRSWFTPGQQ